MATGSPGFHPATVTPKIICDLGVSSICMRGSSLGSFESRSSRRPSRGLEEREAGNWIVIVCAEAEATRKSKEALQRILKYTNFSPDTPRDDPRETTRVRGGLLEFQTKGALLPRR